MASLICLGFTLFVLIALIATIAFYFLALQRVLAEVRPCNREMEPALVWLCLIPVFTWFWSPLVVIKIANSLHNEFEYRGLRIANESFGRTIGLFWTLGSVVGLCFILATGVLDEFVGLHDVAALLGCVNFLLPLALLACWIGYWSQIANYTRRLRMSRSRGRGETMAGYDYAVGSVEEDYDDNFRGRSSMSEDTSLFHDADRDDPEPRTEQREGLDLLENPPLAQAVDDEEPPPVDGEHEKS